MEIFRGRETDKIKEFFFNNYKKGESINILKTAKSLGVSRTTLYKWIKEING